MIFGNEAIGKMSINAKGWYEIIFFLMTWSHDKKILKIPPLPKNIRVENEFNKIIGYKTSLQKLVEFLYINDELSGKEVVVTIPFMIASKTLRRKFSHGMEDMHYEKYKTLI